MGKKFCFRPKNVKKTRFLGFSHITELNRFAFLLYCSDDAQTYRVVAQLDVQGVPIIKMASLLGKKFCFRPKNVKKTRFSGFSHITALKQFAFLLCCYDDAQTYRVVAELDVQGVPIIKRASLLGKNICFRPKNFKKTRFLGFSCITELNRFAFLLYCSDDAQTYRVVAQLDVQGVPIGKSPSLIGKKFCFRPKNVKKTRFLGFSHITELNRFAFLLYCSDDAQTYRVVAQLDVQGVPIIKMASLMGKKFCFRPKNVKKTRFSGFSHITALKQFAFLLCCYDDAQTYRVVAQLDVQGVPIIKRASLLGKNICFRPKNFKKTRFLGFSCITELNRFAFLLYCSDDAQTYRVVAQLDVQGVPIGKSPSLIGKKFCFRPKNVKKTRFLGFSHITELNRFAFLLYCSDDAQTYRVVAQLDVQGVPIRKCSSLMGKKFCFRPKNVKKTRFLGFSHITELNRFEFLLYCSDDAQTYRVVAQLDVQGVPIIKRASLSGKNFCFRPKNVKKNAFFGVFTHYCTKTIRIFTVLLR